MHPVTHPPVRRARTRGRWAVMSLVALVATTLALPSAAQAQDPSADDRSPAELIEAADILADTLAEAPADEPASPDDVFVAVVEARTVAAEAATARLVATDASTKAREAAYAAVLDQQAAAKVVNDATTVRIAAKRLLAEERTRLSDLTVKAYVTGGDIAGESDRAILNGDTTDPARGRAVIFEQVLDRQEQITDGARKDAGTARKALVDATAKLDAATEVATSRSGTAEARARDQAAAERAHEAATAELADAEARLRRGSSGAIVPQDVAIIGLPRLSAGDLAAWFAASPYQPRVSTPIEDYAAWFIQEGATEGIRGDIAFAQAVLETGGFANQDTVVANNFSGIGHCDTCASGWTFPSPRMGVRAQIQLLKSYAMKKPPYVNDLVDKRLRGPAGCCDTWGDLTTVWATDPTYGPKVMLLYSSMVDTALKRRAAGIGFDDPAPVVPAPA